MFMPVHQQMNKPEQISYELICGEGVKRIYIQYCKTYFNQTHFGILLVIETKDRHIFAFDQTTCIV